MVFTYLACGLLTIWAVVHRIVLRTIACIRKDTNAVIGIDTELADRWLLNFSVLRFNELHDLLCSFYIGDNFSESLCLLMQMIEYHCESNEDADTNEYQEPV